MTTPTKEQIRPTEIEQALIASAYCRLQFGFKKCSECPAFNLAWESITKDDCASCKLKGRFNGVKIEKAITEVEKALKRYAVDMDIIRYRELAEIAINTLLELNK